MKTNRVILKDSNLSEVSLGTASRNGTLSLSKRGGTKRIRGGHNILTKNRKLTVVVDCPEEDYSEFTLYSDTGFTLQKFYKSFKESYNKEMRISDYGITSDDAKLVSIRRKKDGKFYTKVTK